MLTAKFSRHLLTAITLGALIHSGVRAENSDSANASAFAESLKVGDDAPALKAQQWLQGEPVTTWEKDKTYLIECWATWDGRSIVEVPHLNALHAKFKDKGLVIVGMSIAEPDAAAPAKFLKAQGVGMAYRVAFDGGKTGDTVKNWMRATGVNSVPYAFVVREGKLLWLCNPAELDDATVESMISGKFDPVKAEKALDPKKVHLQKFQWGVGEAIGLARDKKFDEALAKLTSLEKIAEGDEADRIRFLRVTYLVGKGDADAGKSLVTLANSLPESLAVQYFAANSLLNAPQLKDQRDPKFAKTCTGRLLTGGSTRPDFIFLDAQADYALGDKAAAEKTLIALAASTDKKTDRILPKAKAKAALEAVKAGKDWPAEIK